jgi:hypothetical protein
VFDSSRSLLELNRVAAVAVAEFDGVTAVAVAKLDDLAAVMAAEFDSVAAVAVAEFDSVTTVAVAEFDSVTAVAVTKLDDLAAVVATEFDSVTAVAVAEKRAEGRNFSVSRSDELESDKPSEAKCPQNEQRRSQRCIHGSSSIRCVEACECDVVNSVNCRSEERTRMIAATKYASLGGRVLGTLLQRRKSYPLVREAGTARNECETGIHRRGHAQLIHCPARRDSIFFTHACKPFQSLRNMESYELGVNESW